jgi:hypothetical protein
MRIKLNPKAVEFAKQLIHERKIDDRKGSAELKHHTPDQAKQEEFLKNHSWEEFGKWFLGVHFDRPENTRDRYDFPIGDFESLVRADIIEAVKKAHEYRYMDIERAARYLLDHLDEKITKK